MNVLFLSKLLLLTNIIICCRTSVVNNDISDDVLRHLKGLLQLSARYHIPGLTKSENGASNSLIRHPVKLNTSKEYVFEKILKDSCAADLMYAIRHRTSKWAGEMIDADGKLQSGILRGNFLWMGDFRECSEIVVNENSNQSVHNFHGEYCIAEWHIELPDESIGLPLKTAVCLPDSCNGTMIQSDIQLLLHYMAKLPFVKKYESLLTLNAFTCHKPQEKFDNLAISFLFLVGLFSLLIVSGSIITVYGYFLPPKNENPNIYIYHHSYQRRSSSSSEHEPMPNDTEYAMNADAEPIFGGVPSGLSTRTHVLSCWKIFSEFLNFLKKFLLCFCVFTNGQKILTTEVTQKQLLCIHGIRVLSMVWIILGHTYVHILEVIQNMADVVKDVDNISFQVVMQGSFSVDSFFLISGFLLTYLFLKETEKREFKMNWPYLYIHRYWRLTPVYAVIIFYVTAMYKYTGSGGFWKDTDQYGNCTKYWWWNLLYINNFLSINSMCIAWSWYLANDMQFYVLTTFLLYMIWRWPKSGLAMVVTLLIASWISTLYINHVNGILPLFADFGNQKNYTGYAEQMYHYWDLTYSKPYCRIGPYLVGIILAYICCRNGGKKHFLSWWQQMLGWIIAVFCSVSVIYGLYHLETKNQILFDVYNTFSRTAFSLGVAWVIYCCFTGHAVIVNRILSCGIWIPLSRLTYCAYLIHPVIMSWYFGNLRQPLYFTQTTAVFYFCGFLLVSYGMSFFISLAFEVPMMRLEKSIRQKFTQ